MLHPVRVLLLVVLAWATFLIITVTARAQFEVDLALVIAVDISYSMDTDEQELQREGFAEAFRSPLVHDAIRDGMLGRIGVTYISPVELDFNDRLSTDDLGTSCRRSRTPA